MDGHEAAIRRCESGRTGHTGRAEGMRRVLHIHRRDGAAGAEAWNDAT